MEVIDYELRRYDQWKEDLESRKKKCEVYSKTGSRGNDGNALHSDGHCEPRRRILDGMSLIPIPAGELRRRQIEKQKDVAAVNTSDSKDELKRLTEDYERIKLKFQSLVKKQDQLLRGSFNYLYCF